MVGKKATKIRQSLMVVWNIYQRVFEMDITYRCHPGRLKLLLTKTFSIPYIAMCILFLC